MRCAVLYRRCAQPTDAKAYPAHVFVPFTLPILLTFVLTPPVTALERWVGRVPAVLVVVTLVFTVLGLAGWGVARQMDNLVEDLPVYRDNIRTKIADVRGAGKGGAVEKLLETIEGIKTDLGTSDGSKRTAPRPVVGHLGRRGNRFKTCPQALRDAGANHVASTLAQTREYVGGLGEIPGVALQATTDSSDVALGLECHADVA